MFRNYLQGQADTQLTTLYNSTIGNMRPQSLFGRPVTRIFGSYAPPELVEVLNAQGQVLTPDRPGRSGTGRPERAHQQGMAQRAFRAA